jgi:hypothetical protein
MARKRPPSRSADTTRIDHGAVTDAAMLTTAAGAMTLGLITGAVAGDHRIMPPPSGDDPAPVAPPSASASLLPSVDLAGGAAHADWGGASPIADHAADMAAKAPAAHMDAVATSPEPSAIGTAPWPDEPTPVTHHESFQTSDLSPPPESTPAWQSALHATPKVGVSLQESVSHIYGGLGDSVAAMTASVMQSPALHGALESAATLTQGVLAAPAAAAEAMISAVFDPPATAGPAADLDVSSLVPVSLVPQPLHLGFLGQAHDQHDSTDGAFSALGLHHF